MPKLKPTPTQKRSEIIDSWRRHFNIDDGRASLILGMSRTTLQRRRRVGDWSIDELHRAIRGFNIPPEDALKVLTIGCLPMEEYMERENRRKKYAANK